jgi:hypothetical protein
MKISRQAGKMDSPHEAFKDFENYHAARVTF